jgi:hypothetical protein
VKSALLLLLLCGCAVTSYQDGAVVSTLTTCFGLNVGVDVATKTPTVQLGLIRHESVIAPKDATYHGETSVSNSGYFSPTVIHRAVSIGETNSAPMWRMTLPATP